MNALLQGSDVARETDFASEPELRIELGEGTSRNQQEALQRAAPSATLDGTLTALRRN